MGLVLKKRLGEPVEKGEPLAELHVNSRANLDEAAARLLGAIDISDAPIEPAPLIHAEITCGETVQDVVTRFTP